MVQDRRVSSWYLRVFFNPLPWLAGAVVFWQVGWWPAYTICALAMLFLCVAWAGGFRG